MPLWPPHPPGDSLWTETPPGVLLPPEQWNAGKPWEGARAGDTGRRTGLRLVSAITLANSCDWGPADFTSWRFCSRICRREAKQGQGQSFPLAPSSAETPAPFGVGSYLVPHLQHLLRVRVEGHELVGVLDSDGGPAAAFLHLVRFQPLHMAETKPQQMRVMERGDPSKCVAGRETSINVCCRERKPR